MLAHSESPAWMQAASHSAGSWCERKIRSAGFLCFDAERVEGGIGELRISAEIPNRASPSFSMVESPERASQRGLRGRAVARWHLFETEGIDKIMTLVFTSDTLGWDDGERILQIQAKGLTKYGISP
jgi:hypothetical protein